MPRMSDGDIYVTVFNAGFGGGKATVTAVAIALAESSGDSTAVNRSNSNGSTDYGLFQINSVHAGLLRKYNWRDPKQNAKMAYIISGSGSNFAPWTVYKSGAYRAYVGRAMRAASGAGTFSGKGTGSAPGGAPDSASGDGGGLVPASDGFAKTLTEGSTWLRVGMFIVGLGLIAMVALSLSGQQALQIKKAFL